MTSLFQKKMPVPEPPQDTASKPQTKTAVVTVAGTPNPSTTLRKHQPAAATASVPSSSAAPAAKRSSPAKSNERPRR